MTSTKFWTLRHEDGSEEKFIDVRRKVGNKIIRAYLLDSMLNQKKIELMKGSLRGPRKEFQDFGKFMILCATHEGRKIKFLAETGVYENLRIVAVDDEDAASRESEELEGMFCDALQYHEKWNSRLMVSPDSTLAK